MLTLIRGSGVVRHGSRELGLVQAVVGALRGEEFLVVLNAGRQPATVSFDLAPWGGTLKATDALQGGTQTWSGTATLDLPGETGRVFQITR